MSKQSGHELPDSSSLSHGSSVAVSHSAFAAGASPLLSLIDRLSDAVLVLDCNWRFTYANAEAFRISRLVTGDLNSTTHWDKFPSTIGTELERTYREAMRSGTDAHLEYFHAPFDVWLDIHILTLPDGLALHYREITGRKRAGETSGSSMHKQEQVLEACSDSIVCIDRNWNCTFANIAALTILKTDALIGANLWTRFPGNNEEPFASNYRATMEQRIPTEFEAYYPEPLDIWFRVYAQPFDDGIIIFSNDITSRKRAESVRDAAIRQLNQVLEVTTDAVFSIGRNWNFTLLNQRAVNLLQRDDLVGKNIWQEFPAAIDSDFNTFYRQSMDHGISGEFEAYYPEPLSRRYAVQCRPSDDGIVVFFSDITERRRADEIAREQRELITFVQQAARTAFWKLDLTTGKLAFDDGSYPVFGHPLATLTSREEFHRIVHPDDRAQVAADVERAATTGELIVNDFRVVNAAGNTIWLEARSQSAVVDGRPATLGGMTIDITARKCAEQALAASEERYRVLTELSPQFLWMGSPTGKITYANQGFQDYLGLTREDVADDRWMLAFDPADRHRTREAWYHAIATGETFEIEARLIEARTGEPRWWWLRALPLRSFSDERGNGTIVSWLGVSVDIHDRKTAADALHQKQLETERQRAELETLYRTAPIGLALFDPVEFRYLRLNDRQAEIVGLPLDEVLGRRVTEIAPIPGLGEMFQQVADGSPIRNAMIEGSVATRPEDHRYWNVNYFPVYGADGTVRAITAASMEITNQKRAENALIESEKLAAVGRLATSISHEINNPLEAVTNLLYIIANDANLSEDLRPFIETAQSELQRVCQIATQTLRFHRQAVRATLVTPEELVGAVLLLYQGRLANSGITVDARYLTRIPVLCFENDIRQVLNNLIANAIDAMRLGTNRTAGRLLVRAHDATHPQKGPGVRITIADTGHGMSQAVLARVFEPFYTTKALNGTGLGLWISSGIVERHGGAIRIRSSEDPRHHGTVFTLFLPHASEPERLQ